MPQARGDEVISPYWRSADGGEVTVRQLAAYHSQGNRATIRWYNQAGSGLPGAGAPAPTNLLVKPTANNVTEVRVTLTWNDNTSNETGFTIQRSSNDGETFADIATVGSNVKTYTTSTGMTAGVQYLFRVRANRSGGNGGNTGFSNVAGTANQLTHLGVHGQTLFPDRADTATGYQPVSFFQPDGAFGFKSDSEFSDDALNDQTVDLANGAIGPAGHHVRFYPAKRAGGTVIPNVYLMAMDYNGINYDYNDNVYIIYNIAPAEGVGSPVGAAAYGDPDAGVKIDWADAVDPSLTGYNVYRAEGAGTFTKLNVSPLTSSDFVDPTAVTGTTYKYQVSSVGTNGEGLPTTINAVRPAAATLAPTAPANASAVAQSSAQVKVSWNDVNGENGFRVEYSNNNGAIWQLAGTVSGGATSMAVDNLDAGTLYQFRVFALNGIGASPASNVASATTDIAATPPIPSGFQATSVTATEVVLTWTNVTGETGYRVERSDDGGTVWSIAGTTGTNVTTFTDFSVSGPFTYKYRVRSVTLTAPSAPSSVVTADVPAGIASAPTFVTPTAFSETSIGLIWQNVAGEDGYKVESSLDGSTGWTEIGQTIANQVTFTHSDLTAATKYYYRVRAFSVAVGDTGYSLVGSTTTLTTAPGQPTAVADYASQVTVTWPDVAGETGYDIQRSPDGVAWTTVGTNAANDVDLVDTTVVGDTTYRYRIVAFNEGGTSSPSGVAVVTTPAPPLPAEVIIDNLSATYVGGWSISTTQAGFFGVNYRHDSNGSKGTKTATFIATPPTTSTSYKVSLWNPARSDFASNVPVDIYTSTGIVTVTVNQRINGNRWVQLPGDYDFDPAVGLKVVVRTTGTNGFVIVDAVRFTETTPAASLAPTAPSSLLATGVTPTSISLAWNDNSSNETGFKIARKGPGQATFVDLPNGSLAANTTTFVDASADIVPGGAYQYSVRAVGTNGESNPASSPVITTITTAPTGLASVPAGATKVTLNWADVSGESGYLVQFSTSSDGSTGWTDVGTTIAGTTTITHANLTPSTPYYYRVFGVNTGGNSDASQTLSASTGALPTPPGDFTATAEPTGGVTLNWTDVPDDAGFLIQRATDALNGPWTTVLSPLTDATTAFDPSTVPGTSYAYRIITTNAFADQSTPSDPQSVTAQGILLPPSAPSGLGATVSSPTAITVVWSDNANNEDGYLLQRSDDNGSSWSDIPLAANTTSYVDDGRDPAVPHLYRVTGQNAGGSSAPLTVAADIVVDNAQSPYVVASGTWTTASVLAGKWGADYVHDGNTGRGSKAYSFYPRLTTTGQYEVYVWYPAAADRSSKTKIDVFDLDSSATPQATLVINQRINGGSWVSLGAYHFAAYDPANPTLAGRVRIGNSGANGFVNADAVRFRPIVVVNSPNPPSELTVTNVTTNSVALSWADNSTDETGFIISRRATGQNTFTDLVTVAPNEAAYIDTSVSPGVGYQYQVRAKGAQSDSGTSAVASTVTLPVAPVLNAVVVAGAHRLNLSWPNVTGNTGYLVQVSADGINDWTDLTTTSTGVATYGHTALTPLTTYYYRVFANGASGQSTVSNVVSGTTTGLPTAPTGLDATAETLGGVTLNWTDSADDAGYRVERSLDGTTWTVVGSPSADAITFFDGTTAYLTEYQYRVSSVNSFGDLSADSSNVASVTTGDSPQALPPTNFVVASNTSFRIELSWTDVETDETGYLLQRSADGGTTWTDIPLPADSTGYVDQGRTPSTAYSYRVKATGANGDSDFVALASPVSTPAAPSVEVDNTSVNVTYTGTWATSTAVAGYLGTNYRHDGNAQKGARSVQYTAALPDAAGKYKIGFYYTARSDRASNVPIDVYTKTGIVTVVLNQRINGSQWFEIAGEYEFDSILKVVIRTTGTNGFVMADGVRFRQVS